MNFIDSPKSDLVKNIMFWKIFYKSPLLEGISSENNAESELVMKFYKPMFSYIIDRIDRLSLSMRPSPPSSLTMFEKNEPESEEKSETTSEHNSNDYTVLRMKYVSENVYEGTVSRWMPHGKGRLVLYDNGGVTYEGRLEDGLPDGEGMVRWPDGSWYQGEFQGGLRHGRGLYVSAEDSRRLYSGQWKHGKRDGPGQTACDSDGALDYTGDWVNGQPHGYGTGKWPDGTQYTGNWLHNKPHGHGRMIWPGDDVYEGDWVNGRMDGTGTYEWNSNPADYDRLVMRSCDKYTGQWSSSKKHGPGVFYSAETETMVHGQWVNDVLDGPCRIILATGRSPFSSGLVFRNNVLYENPPPPHQPPNVNRLGSRRTQKLAAVGRGDRRLSGDKPRSSSSFRWPCERPLAVVGNAYPEQNPNRTGSADLVRANVRSTAVTGDGPTYDLTGHVRRTAAKRSANARSDPALNFETELLTAEQAIREHAAELRELYRIYGSFTAGGPVAYRPLMIRFGLWQMLIDSRLHGRVSLADFDDLLYENEYYALQSAHDPFEPILFWQFIHAVCELATVIYDSSSVKVNTRSTTCGFLAWALHKLLAEHVRIDVVRTLFAEVSNVEPWTNSRKTMTTMYNLFQTMTADESLPTARQLIRLYGPRPWNRLRSPASSDGVLPTVLEIVLGLRDEQTDFMAKCPKTLTTLFECSVHSVVRLLAKACPKIVDDRGALVAVETRFTFAEWYGFVMLCIRESRKVINPVPENDPWTEKED